MDIQGSNDPPAFESRRSFAEADFFAALQSLNDKLGDKMDGVQTDQEAEKATAMGRQQNNKMDISNDISEGVEQQKLEPQSRASGTDSKARSASDSTLVDNDHPPEINDSRPKLESRRSLVEADFMKMLQSLKQEDHEDQSDARKEQEKTSKQEASIALESRPEATSESDQPETDKVETDDTLPALKSRRSLVETDFMAVLKSLKKEEKHVTPEEEVQERAENVRVHERGDRSSDPIDTDSSKATLCGSNEMIGPQNIHLQSESKDEHSRTASPASDRIEHVQRIAAQTKNQEPIDNLATNLKVEFESRIEKLETEIQKYSQSIELLEVNAKNYQKDLEAVRAEVMEGSASCCLIS